MIAVETFLGTLVASLLCISGACGHAQQNQTNQMEAENDTTIVIFSSIGRGGASWKPNDEVFGPQFLLVRTEENWKKLKPLFPLLPNTVDADGLALLEQVSFDRQSVLIFTFGLVGSTGYDLELEKLTVDSTASCYLKGKRPSPSETVGAVMSHPFHLVIVDWTDFPQAFTFYIDDELTAFEIHREQ